MANRREFVLAGVAAGSLMSEARGQSDLPLVRVGVMGLSRGQSLAADLAKFEGVEVKYLCDVDKRRSESLARQFQKEVGVAPEMVGDFRRILDDDDVDALVCAAPNHWHAPATIMACKAGKHVYVEKPCSHNPQEGEWMIQAAEKYKRCVQMGAQRRSAAGTQEAIRRLHAGDIGQVHLARCYYNSLRGPIGRGMQVDPPADLDYDLWQGPAPHVPFRSNVVHYNWHWFWHWGGGELANNGVHGLDLCRWGLNVDFPIRTVSSGGRYWYDDDQETPDVHSVCFEFEGRKQATWDALSCNKHGVDFMCAFYGDEGTLELDSDGQFRIFDRNDKPVFQGEQSSVGQREHLQNFVDAIRADDPQLLNLPITEGHRSTLLCHLGNIAHRTGRTVVTEGQGGHILDDAEQRQYWRREYEAEWEPWVTMS
ncbi:MAG: Gfo/Idh/MocA family oxidoreductase [bacterium]|nr:Gfo/Idh/MocA family oxidoreductase [bacterium]